MKITQLHRLPLNIWRLITGEPTGKSSNAYRDKRKHLAPAVAGLPKKGIGYLGNVIWELFGKWREIRNRGLTSGYE